MNASAGSQPVMLTTVAASSFSLKRPREVPPILWDEILRLRGLRNQLKESIKNTRKVIISHIRQLNLVQEMNMVANHALQGSSPSDFAKPASGRAVDVGSKKRK
ncbi:unnamed protein product [Phytomonas sp. Hart1]|nr:unnamed protein product [Phytomonas sp. Hart1]|eukprot:CCW68055.1 unnamed protein product [Phytomonas sp. isolate Hart1]